MTITCDITGETREAQQAADGRPKLPRGWKRHGGVTYGPTAWAKAFRPRSLHVPVASATQEGSHDTRAGWAELWKSLGAAWGDATRYANTCLGFYAPKDFALPLARDEKGLSLPKIPKDTKNAWLREAYALRRDFPALDSSTAAAIRMECLRTWNRERWNVRIRADKSLPTFRYPFPLPLPADAMTWSVDSGNGYLTARVRIDGRAFVIRLSPSHKYSRNLSSIRAGITGEAVIGETSLLRRRSFGNERGDGGWQIWAAVTVYLPVRKSVSEPDRTLAVTVGGGDLFRAVVAGQERIWTLHADDLLPRIEAYDRQRQRISDDRKFERRCGASGERYQAMSEDRVQRHRRWLDTQLHRRSRELVEFARRNRCGVIRLEMSAPPVGLPWSRLLEMIRQKAAEYGMTVACNDASGDVVQKTP